jgi:hypothetical protein
MRHYNKPDDVTIWHYVLRIGLICIVMFFSVYLFLLLLAGFAGVFGLVFLWNKFRKV